ncbi:MAG: hypothetical protein HYW07_09455 [Candidatus Latescibacteria bacterium]|nr:hypothetical protein [Candidatus Latescibacterota bacterium]
MAESEGNGLTLRALVVGALLCACIGAGISYGSNVIGGSLLDANFSTGAALFLFFFLVGGLNTFLRIVRRSAAFRRGELATIYVMMMVACAIPTVGLTGYLPPLLAAPFYYATPENDWADLIQPHIQPWLIPDPSTAEALFEGLPQGAPIPWEVWINPLLAWGVFLLALYVVMICMMVILRKQWMDHERLIYPLVQVPLDIIRGEETPGYINLFFKSKLMWAGFLIPFVIQSIIALHRYYPYLPNLRLSYEMPIFRNTLSIPFFLSFPTIGFSYLINLDIAFGLWFFSLLSVVEKGIFNVLGFISPEQSSVYGVGENSYLAHQGMGAMIVLVLFGLWAGRKNLKGLWQTALGKEGGEDDSGEILSYRSAILGLLGGLAVMGIWLWKSGMSSGGMVLLFLFGALVVYLGLTRIVVQGGVEVARSPMIASDFVILSVGSSALGSAALVSLAFTYIWSADISTFVMASSANGLKLATETGIGRRKRLLFWAMMLSVVVTCASSFWVLARESYLHGGINFVGQGGWSFGRGAQYPFEYVGQAIQTPADSYPGGWIFTGVGASLMALLMVARRHYLWWPLHPIGFPISVIGYPVLTVWFNVFLAWLFKLCILKYGGPALFAKSRPFFLGLVAGQFVVAGIWLIIDHFTGMVGNQLGLT